jgi:NADH-quinone oxidoreductase subunit J
MLLASSLPLFGTPGSRLLAQLPGAVAAAGSPVHGSILSPVLILILCLVAGVGTVLLLPGRREGPVVKIGGALILGAALVLVALLVRYAAGHGGGMGVYFWVFSAVALIGALRVVTHPRPVYSALYFVLTVFATAGLFILLWAEFMAAALVLIYAGAILVTYVFVIMLAASAAPTGGGAEGVSTPAGDANGSADGQARPAGLAEYDVVSREPIVAAAVGFALMGILLFVIFDRAAAADVTARHAPQTVQVSDGAAERVAETGTVESLGMYLFQSQAVNLELAGLLLTLGMIGAIMIARRRIPRLGRATPAEQRVMTAPMTPINDDPHSIPVYGTMNPRQKAYPEA